VSTKTNDILISQESSPVTDAPVEQLQPTTPATAQTNHSADDYPVQADDGIWLGQGFRPIERKALKPKKGSLAEKLLSNPPIPESLVKIICSKVSVAEKCAAVKQALDEDTFLAWIGFNFYVKHSEQEKDNKAVFEKDGLGFSNRDGHLLEFVEWGWENGQWSERQLKVLRRGMKKYAEQIVARIAATYCPDCIPERFKGLVEICETVGLQEGEEYFEKEEEMHEAEPWI
jgi:hypothetical protein